MKIVILDAHTANPGDLSWEELEAIAPCSIYPRTPADQILSRCQDAEIVFTNKTSLNKDFFANSPALKYVGVLATGYNIVDIEAAKKHQVTVTNIPEYGTRSVAQHTFALLLELTNHVGDLTSDVHQGGWSKSLDFSYWKTPLTELEGKTVVLVGAGRIGSAFAEICQAVGMNIRAIRSKDSHATLLQAISTADVISLHCPLTPATEHLVNTDFLVACKPGVILLNTARGPLIDESALAHALESGQVAGAGLDVLSVEPPRPDNPLLHARNCIITPHVAWSTTAARRRLIHIAATNLQAWLQGHPVNVVG